MTDNRRTQTVDHLHASSGGICFACCPMRRISRGHLSVTLGKFFTKVVLLSYMKYFSVDKILQFKDALIGVWDQC